MGPISDDPVFGEEVGKPFDEPFAFCVHWFVTCAQFVHGYGPWTLILQRRALSMRGVFITNSSVPSHRRCPSRLGQNRETTCSSFCRHEQSLCSLGETRARLLVRAITAIGDNVDEPCPRESSSRSPSHAPE